MAFTLGQRQAALRGPAAHTEPHRAFAPSRRRDPVARPPRQCAAAAVDEASLLALKPAVAVVLAAVFPAAGLAGWRLSLYSQLEVITAKILGGFVPATASPTVVLLLADNSTRSLFYLPKRTGKVLVVGQDAVPSLFEQASLQSSMPAAARQQPCWDLSHVPTGSADAVVSLAGLASAGGAADLQAKLLSEACRVLKPDAPLVFIEPLADGASPLRPVIGSVSKKATPLVASALEELLDRQAALNVVQVDVALEGTDPHAVGVARRSAAAITGSSSAGSSEDAGLEQAVKQAKRTRKPAAADKGFKRA